MTTEDSLVMGRPKRSTAGNRYAQVMAGIDETQQDLDEDDFQFKDEEDAFESDFEETDEEATQDIKDVSEITIQEEDKHIRKTARSKLDKATALAHARQKATFNPQAFEEPSSPRIERRTSSGIVIDPKTGEVTETNERKSQRLSTVMNRSATVSKFVKEAQDKKVPKKLKSKQRAPTQAELMARALAMEEGNIIQHRDYLKLEEEKRKQARVVRPAVKGPLLRWVSRVEEVPVREEPITPMPSTSSHDPKVNYQYHQWSQVAGPSQFVAGTYTSQDQPQQNTDWYDRPLYNSNPPTPTSTSLQASVRKEKVEKNYVVIENQQTEKATRPTWKQTMEGMFGDHVKWDEIRVFSGKRPLSRPVERCPVTGLPAIYCDPRTGVPYANAGAFKEITKVMEHQYVWSQELGCYLGPDKEEDLYYDDEDDEAPEDPTINEAMET